MKKLNLLEGHVHIIGIGGMHMSAIAQLLKKQDVHVTGSDIEATELIEQLRSQGITIFPAHAASNVSGADLVITTAAVSDDHIEIKAAKNQGTPIMSRSTAIAELMSGKKIIAVAGSHGKTSTSTLLATILEQDNFQPMYVLGGESLDLKSNASWGAGKHCVVEADEYKQAFLSYKPDIEIITNIDADHLDDYGSKKNYYDAFIKFTKNLKSTGMLLLCGNDKGTQQLSDELARTTMKYESYGFEKHNTWTATDISLTTSGGSFLLQGPKDFETGTLEISVPGKHAVLNTMAAAAISLHEGVRFTSLQQTVKTFLGVKRRFELIGESRGIHVIDDYAHHPTEVQATLTAIKNRYANHRLIVIYQPHTYSRTAYLWESWLNCWAGLDKLVILETYAARELPHQGKTAEELAKSIFSVSAIYAPNEKAAIENAIENVTDNTIILTLGAGNITNIAPRILEAIT